MKSDSIRSTTGKTQPKKVVSDGTFPWWFSPCKKSKRLLDSFQRYWWSNNTGTLADSVLGHNWKTIFFSRHGVYAESQVILLCTIFRVKKISMDWIFGKSQSFFGGIFVFFPKNQNLFEKSGFVSFFPLRPSNFMWNFRKILLAVFEKNCLLNYWHNDIPTYWQQQFHRTLSA